MGPSQLYEQLVALDDHDHKLYALAARFSRSPR